MRDDVGADMTNRRFSHISFTLQVTEHYGVSKDTPFMEGVHIENLPDGTVCIHQHIGIASRVFGVPFLLLGLGFFGRNLVLGIFEDLPTSHWREIPRDLPGFFILLVMTAVFAGPGFLLIFFRKRVLIRPGAREITDVKDFLLFKSEKRTPIAEGAFIELRDERLSSSSSSRGNTSAAVRASCLYVRTPAEKEAAQALLKTADEARGLAKQISDLLAIPIRDHLEEDERRAKVLDDEDDDISEQEESKGVF
jgi:hypothetical protein